MGWWLSKSKKERMLKLKILLIKQQDGRKASAIIERTIFGILLKYFHIWNPFYTSMANRVYSKHVHQGKSLDKFPSLTNSLRSTYPMISYLFFAWSISMRSVAWGAFPCMCLKYRKSSPLCAIDRNSGNNCIIWLYLS